MIGPTRLYVVRLFIIPWAILASTMWIGQARAQVWTGGPYEQSCQTEWGVAVHHLASLASSSFPDLENFVFEDMRGHTGTLHELPLDLKQRVDRAGVNDKNDPILLRDVSRVLAESEKYVASSPSARVKVWEACRLASRANWLERGSVTKPRAPALGAAEPYAASSSPPPPTAEEAREVDLADEIIADVEAKKPPIPPKPRTPFPPPNLLPVSNRGTECIEFTMTKPVLSDNQEYWNYEFNMHNRCDFDVLYHVEFAEIPKGAPAGYTPYISGPPLVFGGTWVNWNHDTWPDLGFTDFDHRGSGARIERTWYFHGRDFKSARSPTPDFQVWIVSCEAYTSGNSDRLARTMFVEGKLLIYNPKFSCVPNIKWP